MDYNLERSIFSTNSGKQLYSSNIFGAQEVKKKYKPSLKDINIPAIGRLEGYDQVNRRGVVDSSDGRITVLDILNFISDQEDKDKILNDIMREAQEAEESQNIRLKKTLLFAYRTLKATPLREIIREAKRRDLYHSKFRSKIFDEISADSNVINNKILKEPVIDPKRKKWMDDAYNNEVQLRKEHLEWRTNQYNYNRKH